MVIPMYYKTMLQDLLSQFKRPKRYFPIKCIIDIDPEYTNNVNFVFRSNRPEREIVKMVYSYVHKYGSMTGRMWCDRDCTLVYLGNNRVLFRNAPSLRLRPFPDEVITLTLEYNGRVYATLDLKVI